MRVALLLPLALIGLTAEPCAPSFPETPTPIPTPTAMPTPTPSPTPPPTPTPAPIACRPDTTAPEVLRVPEDCPRLQDALASAQGGDTLSIAAGNYVGAFSIPDIPLTLSGRGAPGETVLEGPGSGRPLSAAGAGDTPLYIEALTLRGGRADLGGGLSLLGRDTTLTSVVVAGNKAVSGCDPEPRTISNPCPLTQGGGIYAQGGRLRLVESEVLSNEAGEGGGIYGEDVAITLEGGRIGANFGVQRVAGTYEGEATIYGVWDGYGGGSFLQDGEITLEGARIEENTSLHGGGIFLRASDLTAQSATWSANVGYHHRSQRIWTTHQLPNIVYEFTGEGGALVLEGPSHGTLKDCILEANRALAGGAIAFRGASLTLTGGRFEANSAHESITESDLYDLPGGIDVQRRYHFGGAGGAIFAEDALHIQGVDFIENTSLSGGALHIDYTALTLTGGTFRGNVAYGVIDSEAEANYSDDVHLYTETYGGIGGAIRGVRAFMDVSGIRAEGGQSVVGGVIALESGTLSLRDAHLAGGLAEGVVFTDFRAGTSESEGRGGILANLGGALTLDHVALVGGEAFEAGGGIYASRGAEGGSVRAMNVSIVQGRAPSGAGMWLDTGSAPASLVNTLLAFNEGAALTWTEGSAAPEARYCDLYGNDAGDAALLAALSGPGMLSADPGFVAFDPADDPAGQDVHLSPGSPCLGAGEPAPEEPAPPIGAYGLPGASTAPDSSSPSTRSRSSLPTLK